MAFSNYAGIPSGGSKRSGYAGSASKSASAGRSVTRFQSSAKRQGVFRFPALDGGLNLRDAEINLKDNESPEIVNLWWADGGLCSRPGQEAAASGWTDANGDGHDFAPGDIVYAAAAFPEGIVAHIGAALYTWHGDLRQLRPVGNSRDIPRNPGDFFRFGDTLYYKNVGGFYRLSHDPAHASDQSPLTLSLVAESAFVPTVLVNAEPETGQGDAYQSPNRLSPFKRVRYRASGSQENVVLTGNGFTRAFSVDRTASENLRGVSAVYTNNTLTRPALYSVDVRTGTVIFNTAPAEDAVLTFTLEIGTCVYCLPEVDLSAVTQVRADGLTMEAGRDYTADPGAGIVTFTHAPAQSVEITYQKPDAAALAEIMDCPRAAACGGYLVMGGASGNASGASSNPSGTGDNGSGNPSGTGGNSGACVHWSGLTESGPDASYWPADASVFVGDSLTGFGTQYDQTIVFQSRRIGKLTSSVKTVNGCERVCLAYSVLNERIGCDLPRSVRLVGNNLLFANTSGGVYQIRSASAARENNIRCLSGKVNGSDTRPGLLYDMRVAGTAPVLAHDDGQRYWLAVNGHVWLWDYEISDADDPVWFYFTGLSPHAFADRDGVSYLLDAGAQVVRLGNTFRDFESPIRKVYQFPVRNFGSYERLKDVRSVVFAFRADTLSHVSVSYESDYENRAEPVNPALSGYDRLTERNLETRDLSVPRHAAVFRRDPKCRHVRHFAMRLENRTAGEDLAPYCAEIHIRYTARER